MGSRTMTLASGFGVRGLLAEGVFLGLEHCYLFGQPLRMWELVKEPLFPLGILYLEYFFDGIVGGGGLLYTGLIKNWQAGNDTCSTPGGNGSQICGNRWGEVL